MSLTGHSDVVYCCAFSSNDARIVSCSADHTVKVCVFSVIGSGVSLIFGIFKLTCQRQRFDSNNADQSKNLIMRGFITFLLTSA